MILFVLKYNRLSKVNKMSGENVNRDGNHGRGNGGALPTSNNTTRVKKSTPKRRTLGIEHLDRSDGYADEHYSWKEVAKACHVQPGGHE